MLKREWQKLFKNKILVVVMIAIIAIPTIYTTLFLGSMWDPYGQLNNLPVAVINKDKAVTYNDQVMNVGKDLVDNLKDNDSLAFDFVDEETAQRGLENGIYYMTITIPEDFSANATTLMGKEPKNMELKYATNPGTNYIASKMSETALAKIKDSVSSEVTKVYAGNMFDKVGEIGNGMQNAADGSKKLRRGVNEISDGISDYTDGVKKAASGTAQLTANNDALNQGVENLSMGVGSLQDGSAKLLDGLSNMSITIGSSMPASRDIMALEKGLDTYSAGINQLNSELNKLSVSDSSTEIGISLGNIGESTKMAAGNLKGIANATAILSAANLSPEQLQALQTIVTSTQNVGNNLSTIASETQNVGANLTTLSNSMGKLNEFKSAVGSLAQNSQLVLGGSKAAIDGLYSGMNGVKTSLDQTVIHGVKTLNEGIGKVNIGVNSENGLKNSINDYTNAVSQINSGVLTLDKNSSKLKDGMNELNNGTDELSSKLSGGAKEVQEVTASDDTINMFASPIDSKGTKITSVENNGHAMAPYMMSVALWVAAIALCIMYPLTEYEGELKSGLSWWSSKASVVFSVAVVQALVMIFMLHSINGFNPQDMGKTIFMACLASLAFMAIMYFFNVCLGKVGSFIMLIFMVVQLAGSAGTYPIEISGGFVAKIHKFLPFSYTVDAFRSTISGGGNIKHAVMVLSFVFLIFTLLTIGVFQFRAKRIKENKPVLTEILENQGLA